MSLVHMIFEKDGETADEADYIVMSGDFNPERDWKAIGKLTLDKKQRSYSFLPMNEWAEQKINMDTIIRSGLEGAERAKEYSMAWKGRIHVWAMRMLEAQKFPPHYPG